MECYVNYEIAKKLKEKGFSLNNEDVELIGCRFIFSDKCTIKRISMIGAYEKWYFGENIDCPTIPQVLNWLRQKQAIHIETAIREDGWFSTVFVYEYYEEENQYSIKQVHETKDYKSYEQASLEGIKYVLDNLI